MERKDGKTKNKVQKESKIVMPMIKYLEFSGKAMKKKLKGKNLKVIFI